MKNEAGLTLAELMVGLVVGAIVILMVGAIGNIASQSYHDLYDKSNVYADAQSALQLIRESVRKSTAAPAIAGNCLTVTINTTSISFYVSGNSLVYGSSCNTVTGTFISNVTSLVFTPDSNSPALSKLPLISPVLSGSKNGVNFSYSINVSRRNP